MFSMSRPLTIAGLLALAVVVGAVALATPDSEWPGEGRSGYLPPRKLGGTVLWALGDGADGSRAAARVAEMVVRRNPDRFLYLGDVYETGSAAEYESNYAPAYGPLERRTAPTVGNHEFAERSEGYIPYWTDVHGSAPPYYSFRASGWQLLGLNSELEHDDGSAQRAWLGRMLAARPRFGDCRLAFWHRPRYSAGYQPDAPDIAPLWRPLRGRARIVLTGHDHNMQRFEPRAGIHQFISGAGGHEAHEVDEEDPRLAFANDSRRGALRIRLGHEEARWRFVSVRGRVLDSGRLSCRRG